MPCRVDYPDWDPESCVTSPASSALQEARDEADKVTRLLCSTCRAAEAAELLERLPKSTQAWWKRHKQSDRSRRQAERDRAARKRLPPAKARK